MDYVTFIKEIKEKVEELVQGNLEDCTVFVHDIIKNNNVRMRAISIERKNDMATPNIYLNDYYSQFKKGRNIDDISKEIFEVYLDSSKGLINEVNINDLRNFSKVKKRIFYKLVNYNMNREMLKTTPHVRVLDLAIVFYILVSYREGAQAVTMIRDGNIKEWGIDLSRLCVTAYENTWTKYQPVIRRMEDIISEMILDSIVGDERNEDNDDGDLIKEETCYGGYTYAQVEDMVKEEMEKVKLDRNMEMYVMTNEDKSNGAACILYPGVLKKFADKLGQDIYIIPSSIHEVILIPAMGWDTKEIDEMIREVNRTQLDPVEILSDHVYVYKRETEELGY